MTLYSGTYTLAVDLSGTKYYAYAHREQLKREVRLEINEYDNQSKWEIEKNGEKHWFIKLNNNPGHPEYIVASGHGEVTIGNFAIDWEIEEVEGKDNCYKIRTGSYYMYANETMVATAQENYIKNNSLEDQCKWYIESIED